MSHLLRQGFECFAPEHTAQIICIGKLREQQQPLFAGYVVIRLGAEDSGLSLRLTRGVSRIGGLGREFADIEAIFLSMDGEER